MNGNNTKVKKRATNSRHLALVIGLAALLAGGIASTAHADGWREHRWREHEWREHMWRERAGWGYGYGYAAPPVVVAPPPAIYAPPPVVVAPPVPPPGLNIVLPLNFR